MFFELLADCIKNEHVSSTWGLLWCVKIKVIVPLHEFWYNIQFQRSHSFLSGLTNASPGLVWQWVLLISPKKSQHHFFTLTNNFFHFSLAKNSKLIYTLCHINQFLSLFSSQNSLSNTPESLEVDICVHHECKQGQSCRRTICDAIISL